MGFVFAVVALALVGAAVYWFAMRKKDEASAPVSGWAFAWSKNVAERPNVEPDGAVWFDFPQSDGVHYVIKAAPPIALGQRITMLFSLEGDGKLIAVDGDPVARVRIMLQQRGDDMATADARWWSLPLELKGPGDYTLATPVVFGNWITIGGGLPTAGEAGFVNCINNLGNIGLTFGGWSAGHGVYAQGPARFVLRSLTVSY